MMMTLDCDSRIRVLASFAGFAGLLQVAGAADRQNESEPWLKEIALIL